MKKNDEQFIQIYICSFLRKLQLSSPNFLFFHTPNGGGRNKVEAANLKMAGLLPGIPDLCLMGKGFMQFVELKKRNGSLSVHQKEFIRQARGFGWIVDVIYADDPAEAISLFFPIMEKFGYDQKGMEYASSSTLSSLK